MHAARRMESVLACENEAALRLAAASMLVVLWHRLHWPCPDRILIVPRKSHCRELREVAEEFARMMDLPLAEEFCLRWQSPFVWRIERHCRDLLENQTILLIDWAGSPEHLRQAISELRGAFAKTIHILSVFS
ncbi:MAG: hypothetical protein HW387_732 [Parachlamydiales bacterium]|nr:hypothetical protein [Parachlamydiales bacterium]